MTNMLLYSLLPTQEALDCLQCFSEQPLLPRSLQRLGQRNVDSRVSLTVEAFVHDLL